MSNYASASKRANRPENSSLFPLLCFLLFAVLSASSSPLPKNQTEPSQAISIRIEAPVADVTKAVEGITQDQIIHGTYSYEKERILYGAHSASSVKAFGAWQGQGQVFYKVADKVLAPRFFKDTGDIGTIYVRYVVTEVAPSATTLQIDALFIDARNVKHPSLGAVESSEYAAIQQRLKSIQASQRELLQASTAAPPANPASSRLALPPAAEPRSPAPADQNSSDLNVKELQNRVATLRHEAELRVRDSGAPLKAAPFHSSATLETLPPQSELLIVVLTPYWYGVETEDGHHGWVHRNQLEPLP